MTTIGFTGSRQGITPAQRDTLRRLLEEIYPDIVVHGCAIGADAQFAFLCSVRSPRPHIIGYPSDQPSQTDDEACGLCDEIKPPSPPLRRNREIVDTSNRLLACPASDTEELRSGTWATIRYARRKQRHITLILPDGSIREEGGPL